MVRVGQWNYALVFLAISAIVGHTWAADSPKTAKAAPAGNSTVKLRYSVGADDWPASEGHIVVTTPHDHLSGGAVGGEGSCHCVPYYQCSEDESINTDGIGIIDIRKKGGDCEHYLEYCCKLKNHHPENHEPHHPEPTHGTYEPHHPEPHHPEPTHGTYEPHHPEPHHPEPTHGTYHPEPTLPPFEPTHEPHPKPHYPVHTPPPYHPPPPTHGTYEPHHPEPSYPEPTHESYEPHHREPHHPEPTHGTYHPHEQGVYEPIHEHETTPYHPTPAPGVHHCGHRHAEGVGFRITGDEDGEAQYGEFPWMVAILQQIENHHPPSKLYQCGGALISPNVVLTGAHCVHDKLIHTMWIRAGEWDTQTTNEIYLHQDRQVSQVIIHPQFNPQNLHHDIALLILAEPVKLGGQIGLICLPEQDQIFDHSRCFASGWGKDKFEKDGQYQVILKKRELPIVPNHYCEELLRKTRLGKFFKLDISFICAGGEPDRDTCQGDGGSPLVCPSPHDPNKYYQAGIVAWGIDCGKANIPGVYASVSKFRHWIDEELNKLNFHALEEILSE